MKKIKIPTVLAILLLTLSLSLSILLINQRQIISPKAKDQEIPQDVKVSNITDSSFTVTWITKTRVNGSIKFGKNKNSLGQVVGEETPPQGYVHSATVRNLEPQATYYFEIISGGDTYDNGGKPWTTTTASKLTSQEATIQNLSGSIVTTLGTPPASALVFIKIHGASLLSTFTSANGNWIVPVNNIRTEDLKNSYQITKQDLIEISVQAGPEGIASAQIYAGAATTTPTITLGQIHDFRNITANQPDILPKSEVQTPEVLAKQPKFDVSGYENSPNTTEVSIESVEEGETVYTNSPEFFGRAPANKEITITVESENPQTETVSVGANGVWRWSPPSGLNPGTHKITLTYRDETGILRSIVRTFVVQAAETGEPAFEATPSASLTPTPTSIVATATPSAQKTASPSATPAQPVSGVKTPTLILFGTGLLLFVASGFLLFAN